MAIGNILQGHLVGRIGDQVFRVSRGKQVVSIVPTSSSRKSFSYAQCREQAIAVTLSLLYSQFRDIILSSWQYTRKPETIHARFLSAGRRILRNLSNSDRRSKLSFASSRARFALKFTPAVVPAQVQFSKGKMGQNAIVFNTDFGYFHFRPYRDSEYLIDYLQRVELYRNHFLTFLCVNLHQAPVCTLSVSNDPAQTNFASECLPFHFVVSYDSLSIVGRRASDAHLHHFLRPINATSANTFLSLKLSDAIGLQSFFAGVWPGTEYGCGGIAIILSNDKRTMHSTSEMRLFRRDLFGTYYAYLQQSYSMQYESLNF